MECCNWRAQGCCTMKDRATRIPRPATGMPANIIVRIFVLHKPNSKRAGFIIAEDGRNTAVLEF